MLTLKEIEQEGEELKTFRELLQEYQAFLGVDLCFQKFERELTNPLSRYTPPHGIVLLGSWQETGVAQASRLENVCACGALQDLGDNVCELKRIYVRPAFRRRGIARSISEYLLTRASEIGYQTAKLDTLRRLTGAVELYASLGFQETAPYNFNPEADIVYMEKTLNPFPLCAAEGEGAGDGVSGLPLAT